MLSYLAGLILFQAPMNVVDNPVGKGAPAKKGDLVTINFLVQKQGGVDVADSDKRGLPYTFKIGEKGNDPLFDLVVVGMRPGGKRVAKLLAKDVYGAEGIPNVVAASDRLTVTVTFLRRK